MAKFNIILKITGFFCESARGHCHHKLLIYKVYCLCFNQDTNILIGNSAQSSKRLKEKLFILEDSSTKSGIVYLLWKQVVGVSHPVCL